MVLEDSLIMSKLFSCINIFLSRLSTDATVSFDSLRFHRNFSFGTWDRDPADGKCKTGGGGWWYGDRCVVTSNFNGFYPSRGKETHLSLIYWAFLGSTAKASFPVNSEMKIRPVKFK